MNNKEKFEKYDVILREWSNKMNLIAPSTLNDIEQRHFADSVQLTDYLPQDVHIVDLGSGAGFPGVVLAVLGWKVTCIESVGKKASFLNELKKELDLKNLEIFNGRVEDFVKNNKNTNVVFTARAFASLDKILTFVCCVKKYRLFLLKGRGIHDEIAEAKKHFSFDYTLFPSKTGDGFIVIIDNVKSI